MGSPSSEDGRLVNEMEHQVTISSPYYMGVYEVTQKQYREVMHESPSVFKGDDLPVESVTHDDVQRFIEKLNALPSELAAGRKYSLPTEAQWEYACRAGSRASFYFGDARSQLDDFAWFDENSGSKTHAVGQKKPNAWGLHDMHGNVWEWCLDWYGDYPKGKVTDPMGPSTGISRVHRGGAWGNGAAVCRSANRYWFGPSSQDSALGFRLALSLTGTSPDRRAE